MSDESYDGPAILDGLREARAAINSGDHERGRGIAQRLRTEHGDEPVDAIIAGLRTGFITLDPEEDQ